MNVAAHQEKEKNEKTNTGKRRQEKREDRRLILKKLRAALLRSFRGQHNKKMVCERGVLGETGTLGKANNHFDPTQKGLGTAPPR